MEFQENYSDLSNFKNLIHLFDQAESRLIKIKLNIERTYIIGQQNTLEDSNSFLQKHISICQSNKQQLQSILQIIKGEKHISSDCNAKIELFNKEDFNLIYLEYSSTQFCSILSATLLLLNNTQNNKDFINNYKQINIQISIFQKILEQNIYFNCLKTDKNDLILRCNNAKDKDWALIKQRLQYINININKQQLAKQFDRFQGLNGTMNCMVQKTYTQNSGKSKQMLEFFWMSFYFFQQNAAIIEAQLCQINPDPKLVIANWNVLNENFVMRRYIKSIIPSVKSKFKISVPKLFKPIILDELYDQVQSGSLYSNIKRNPQLLPQQIRSSKDYDIFEKFENGISVRIQSNIPFVKKNSQLKNAEIIENVVYHIHGGGWVGLDSFAHQMYTLKWVDQLKNVPVISVDYCKAPQNRYPIPLDDCWQVYQFLLNGIENYFENVKIKKIIIAGDSAGGNMAIGICLKALQEGIKLPDGLVLSYPGLNLNIDFYTPSFQNIFTDSIVPFTFLKVCLDSYVDKQNTKMNVLEDPFLSPILIPENVLQFFPPIRMGCGDKDVLRDDCLRFLSKLLKVQHNVKMIIYNDLSHGYLNLNLPIIVPDTYKCCYDCGLFIKQLLNEEKLEELQEQS